MVQTGQSYIVPLRIDLPTLVQPLIQIEADLTDWTGNVTRFDSLRDSRNSHLEDIADIALLINNYKTSFRKRRIDLIEYFQVIAGPEHHQSRSERSLWFKILGAAAQLIMGFNAQSRISRLHEEIGKLQGTTVESINMVNTHTRVLNATLRDVHKLEEAQAKLATAHEVLTGLVERVIRRQDLSRIRIRALQSLTGILLALSDIDADITNVKFAINSLLRAKLSPLLLPKDALLTLLNEIAKTSDKALLFPVNEDFLHLYYESIKVMPYQDNNVIMCYLLIPLEGNPNEVLDVFKVTSIPNRIPDSEYFVIHDTLPEYVAFTETRDLYQELTSGDLASCQHFGAFLICGSLGPWLNSAVAKSCVSSSFLGQEEAESLCHRRLLKTFPAKFVWSYPHWVYSTAEEVQLTINCPGSRIKKDRTHVQGVGLLKLQEGCSAAADSVILPAHSTSAGVETAAIPIADPASVASLPQNALDVLREADLTVPAPIEYGAPQSPVQLTELLSDINHATEIRPLKSATSTLFVLFISIASIGLFYMLTHISCWIYLCYRRRKLIRVRNLEKLECAASPSTGRGLTNRLPGGGDGVEESALSVSLNDG